LKKRDIGDPPASATASAAIQARPLICNRLRFYCSLFVGVKQIFFGPPWKESCAAPGCLRKNRIPCEGALARIEICVALGNRLRFY
jgi:hypothetical protein